MVELWRQLLLAEEQGKASAREAATIKSKNTITKQTLEADTPKKPIIFERNNLAVVHSYDLIDIQGHSGEVEELIIRATTDQYSLDIDLDHKILHRRTWEDFRSIADDSEAVTAFVRDGKYVLGVKSLYFTEYVKIVLIANSITFDKIWLKATYV